jgi:putative ABC transport system permease protein
MNDLRFAFRQLGKQPGFTAIAVLTLGLGIGATATVFSLIQGVLLTPPPYHRPEEITLITPVRVDGQRYTRGWAPEQWQEWQRESKTLAGLAGYGWTFNFLVLPDGSESVEGMMVSPEYFSVMGVPPLFGRALLASDMAGTRATAILLGYDLWQRRFQGDPGIVGRAVQISRNSQPLTVVGVMPPDVRFLPSPNVVSEPNYDVDSKVDYWLPVQPDPERMKRPDWNIVARLRPGVSVAEAQAEIAAMTARQAGIEPAFAGITSRFVPLSEQMNQEGRRLLLPMAGAVALVFLIACGNAAGLLLARGLQRQREYAVRSALGARPSQLCRPILTESLLLAFLGALLAAGLALGGTELLKRIGGVGIPRLDAVQIGWPVLLFGLAAAAVAGMVAGLLPAWRVLRQPPADELKAGSRSASLGRPERRLLTGVAAVQIALTLALLVGAGLLMRTVHSLAQVRPGYDTENILTFSVTTVGTNWLDFHTRSLERVAQLPGVRAAAFGWGVPLTGNKWNVVFDVAGQDNSGAVKDQINLPTRAVTPDYFTVLGMTLTEGRAFRSGDKGDAPAVAIFNQAAAERYFPGRSAVGQRLRYRGSTNDIEIVGVLANSRTDSLTDVAEPEIYLSLWQATAFSKHLILRTVSDPGTLVGTIQRELRQIDPTASVEHPKTLEQIRADSTAARTFAMNLLVGFAGMACLLAIVGIYGVLSLATGARQSEIAIRLAIGAQRSDVFRMILGDGVRLAAVGIGLGLLVAMMLAGGLRTYLYGVGAADPLIFIGMGCVVLLLTLLTGWIPARRATRVDPLAALRNE